MSDPKVELTLPVMQDMELAATKTAEVVANRMGLDEMKTAEINMALIEACINAFEHSKTKDNVFITYIIEGDTLVIKVGDKGQGLIPRLLQSRTTTVKPLLFILQVVNLKLQILAFLQILNLGIDLWDPHLSRLKQ